MSGKDHDMKTANIGFLGAGNMCIALCKGMIESGLVDASRVYASRPNKDHSEELRALNINLGRCNRQVVENSEIIILCVKPHIVTPVLEEIKDLLNINHMILTVVAGILTTSYEEKVGEVRVMRCVPNTPSLVQCGAAGYSRGTYATDNDCKNVHAILSSVGICELLPEKQLDMITGISGSGPAYMFVALEALADGAVKMGLPRLLARKLAAQTMMGAAKMSLEREEHTADLKDSVCSPGGTTIAAIAELEKNGFRYAIMSAVEAATNKAVELGQQNK